MKKVNSDSYNYIFNYNTGFFARWGKTLNDDPDISPLGPEIFDLEVTTACTGIGPKNQLCGFCYKDNTHVGKNMSFERFKEIFLTLPTNLTQIAFGADAKCNTNPDIFKMMEYCRNNPHNYVIPNVTVADVDVHTARLLSTYCGAVAVSRGPDKDACYNSVQRLINCGIDQVNIHVMISQESYETLMEVLTDTMTDPRLKGLKAVVMLSLKNKGRGHRFTPLGQDKFNHAIQFAMENKIPFGMDSCSAHKFIRSIKDNKNRKIMETFVEPCESTCFSAYANVDGEFFPCSFMEGDAEWKEGIRLGNGVDFLNDVWNNERTIAFRNNLLKCNRECPKYQI